MLTIEYREMTSEEQAQLRRAFTMKPTPLKVWLWVWIIFILIPFIGFFIFRHEDNTEVLLFLTILIFACALLEWGWKRWAQKVPAAYQKDLTERKVEVIHVEAAGAAEVEEVSDFGLNFFMEIGDSKLLFLTGQYLYEVAYEIGKDEVERQGKFPNTKFDIMHAPHSRQFLGFDCLGEPLKPSKMYRLPKKEKHFFELHDGQIIPGNLSTLEEDLRKLGVSITLISRHTQD